MKTEKTLLTESLIRAEKENSQLRTEIEGLKIQLENAVRAFSKVDSELRISMQQTILERKEKERLSLRLFDIYNLLPRDIIEHHNIINRWGK